MVEEAIRTGIQFNYEFQGRTRWGRVSDRKLEDEYPDILKICKSEGWEFWEEVEIYPGLQENRFQRNQTEIVHIF